MPLMKDAGAFVSTLGIAVAVTAAPAIAAEDPGDSLPEPTPTPTANGDGHLSDEELAALVQLPADEVSSQDLADLTEADLSRLPEALRDRITQPVQTHYTVSTETTPEFGRSLAATYTKQVRGQWWTENSLGWHLTDYFIAVSFSYNGTKVIEASDWSWGNGNWGYQFCGEDARGSRWVNASHTHYQAFGRGKFGPPGCDIVTMTNGGTVNVNGSGAGWLS